MTNTERLALKLNLPFAGALDRACANLDRVNDVVKTAIADGKCMNHYNDDIEFSKNIIGMDDCYRCKICCSLPEIIHDRSNGIRVYGCPEHDAILIEGENI